MCKRCNEDGRFDQCTRCRAEQAVAVAREQPAGTGFPFRRDGVAWGAFLRFCFTCYTKNFGLLTLATIACFGAVFVLQAISGVLLMALASFDGGQFVWIVLPVLQALLMSLMTLGMLQISLRVVQDQPAGLSLLWSGMPRIGPFLLVSAAIGAALLGLELVLLAVFGLGFSSLDAADWTLGTLLVAGSLGLVGLAASIYVSLGLVFAALELVAQPELSPLTALKNAWRIAHGERLTVGFGLFLISLSMLAGAMFCGVGLVFTLGYAAVLFAALYLALRNGAPLDR
jgi:hypothetical protein